MISRVVFILIMTASTISCQNYIKSNGVSREDKTNRLIIFWGPSIIETDSTMNDGELEVYSDYYYYLVQATPVLRKLGIELKDTTSHTLKIKYDEDKIEIFHRDENSIAYIFTDGIQKPEIIRFVMTDPDLVSAAKKFFNLK